MFTIFTCIVSSLSVKTNVPAFRPGVLTGIALAYLALPNILFVLGWCRPVPALILAASILILFFRTISGNSCSPPPLAAIEAQGYGA